MQKKILILSYSHLKSDPRVMRQIEALRGLYTVETCGLSSSEADGIVHHAIYQIPPFSLFRKIKRVLFFYFRLYDLYYWDDMRKELAATFQKNDYTAIIANDIQTLPLALLISAGKENVYFDAHEYHPKEFEDNTSWRLFHKPYVSYLCKKYIPRAAAFSTVAEGIAKQYEKFIGKKPELITNATRFHPLNPNPVNPEHIKLIHHGAAIRSRKIECMIDMANLLDKRFSMDFMLVGNDREYTDILKQRAGKNPGIRFIEPVSSSDICPFTNAYDLGIFLLPPTNFNYLHALPNKLFEFLQARLGIVVSPNPEMAAFVNTSRLGIVSSDYTPEAMADAINKLTTAQITAFKQQAHAIAQQESAEANIRRIQAIIGWISH
ncbi:MAG: glycosyltransferase [Bacteroidetes bacterium]|nr:glycosyltransferase [Bacteroidota bacterium]